MAIVMKVIIEQDDTGVSTLIIGEGACTQAEAREAEFIHKAIITALESRKGFKRNASDICVVKEIIKSTTEGKNNVH